MTANRLHTILGNLISAGHGRKRVVINKRTFTDNRENDGLCMLPVAKVRPDEILMLDDGGYHIHADEREHYAEVVVLSGESEAAA